MERSPKIRNYRNRGARCYEIGGKFQQDNPDWLLVHATLTPQCGKFEGKKYLHCFNENGETVYDPVLNKMFDRAQYYHDMRVVGEQKYDHVTASRMMMRANHWGPWDDISKIVR